MKEKAKDFFAALGWAYFCALIILSVTKKIMEHRK